jgi:hypothetical protein
MFAAEEQANFLLSMFTKASSGWFSPGAQN